MLKDKKFKDMVDKYLEESYQLGYKAGYDEAIKMVNSELNILQVLLKFR